MIRVIHGMIVATLRVVMPRVTLRVTLDAERPDCRYHAERARRGLIYLQRSTVN